jgi:signal transduction histidine kinase
VPIVTDVEAVTQILFNLVDNACKYAVSATDRTLELLTNVKADTLELSVRDRGPGIPENHRKAIFSPFHRGDRGSGDKTPGVGLGLALSRGLARDLGGDLRLDPPSAPGTRFTLTLPLR